MRRLAIALAFSVSLAALAEPSPAATPSGKYYRPPTPTFSPWFDMFERNTGPLDNYHSFVRPTQRLYGTLQNQGTGLQRQDTGMRSLGRQVQQQQSRQPNVRPTGTGSTFMNLSHYY